MNVPKKYTFDYTLGEMLSEKLKIPGSYFNVVLPEDALTGDIAEDYTGGVVSNINAESTFSPGRAPAESKKKASPENQPPPLPTTIEEINADIARVYGGGNDLIGPDIIREDTYGKAFDLDGIYKSIDTSANKNDCLIHAFLLDVSPNFRKLTDAQKNEYADKWRRQIFVQLFDPVKESELRNEVTNMAFLSDVHLARLSKHFQINVLTFEPVATLGKVKAIYKITNPSNIAIIIYNPRDGHFRAVRKLPESKFIFTHGEAEDISDKYKEEDRTIFDCPYSEGELVVEIATGRLRRIALENKDTLGNNGKIRTTCIGFKFYDALKSPLLPLEEIRKVSVEDFTKMNKEDFDKFTEEDKQKLGEAEKQAYNTRQSAEFKLALSMPLPNSENEEQAPAASLSSAAASSAAAGLQRNDGHNVYFEEKEKAAAEAKAKANAKESAPRNLVSGIAPPPAPSSPSLSSEEFNASKAKANANEKSRKEAASAEAAGRSQAEVNEERRVAAVDRVVKAQNPSQQDYENAKDYWENHMQENEAVYSNYLGLLYQKNLIEKELPENERLDRAKRYFLASALAGYKLGMDNLFLLGNYYFDEKYYSNLYGHDGNAQVKTTLEKALDIFTTIRDNELFGSHSREEVLKKIEVIKKVQEGKSFLLGGNRTRKVKRTS